MSSLASPSGSLPVSRVAPVSGSIRPYAPSSPESLVVTRTVRPATSSHAASLVSGTGVVASKGSCVQAEPGADGDGDG